MTISKTEMFVDLSADLLRRGYGVRFRTNGASMHPTIKDGEAVIVAPVEACDVRRGDIILYKARAGGVIAHRVVGVNKIRGNITSFVLRGDASATCDSPVAPGQVLARVMSVDREGGAIDLASKKANALRLARLWASRARAVIRYRDSQTKK